MHVFGAATGATYRLCDTESFVIYKYENKKSKQNNTVYENCETFKRSL